MTTYKIQTFGCQMNYSDSERVSSLLEQAGFNPAKEDDTADLLIANTCSVRQKSEDKAIGFLTQWKKDHPHVTIAVTGCMIRQTGDASNSKDPVLELKPIDLVFRIEDTARLPKLLEPHFPEHDFSEFGQVFGTGSVENYFHINPKVENRKQVFVPITQGCDKFCSFCIVPYTRGREHSRPMDDILAECEHHVKHGALEITLLGQNVNSYRQDGKKCFTTLVQKIDKLYDQGLRRMRFVSPHPQDFTDDVIEVLAKMRTMCPYIHLPAQHGCDTMLRAMNRNYQVEQYESIAKKIRKAIPGCSLATDIIVGFPGETEQDVKDLIAFAKRVDFDFSYTAIYSPRKNTPAARMKDLFIDREEQKKRFHRFDKMIKATAWARRDRKIGQTIEVLVETSEPTKDGMYKNKGRSAEFYETMFLSGRPLFGQLVNVQIEKRSNYFLNGILPEGTTGLNVIA